MTKYLYGTVLLCAYASAGCLSDDVLRDVQFEAVPVEVPSGEATGTSDINLSFSAIEPLEDGRFILWGLDAEGEGIALAQVEEGSSQILGAGLPIDLVNVVEIIISEEEAGSALPSSLEGSVLMRGQWPGPLNFGDLDEESFTALSGTASIHGKELTAAIEGLPDLPAGFAYGLSLEFAQAESEHEEDESEHTELVPASSEGHDEEGEEGEDVFLGHLSDEGHLEMTSNMMLARGAELAVTIESLHGHEEASHVVVMKGLMLSPDAEDGEEPDSAGGGHGH